MFQLYLDDNKMQGHFFMVLENVWNMLCLDVEKMWERKVKII